MKTEPGRTLGFVGLGQMGAPMARNLARAGHTLVLFDNREDLARQLAQEIGASAVGSPAEVAVEADVVITMLPNGEIVREVILGAEHGQGIVSTAAPGTVFIDMSSSAPTGTQALAKELERRSMRLVDAPVSGGVKKAVQGTLAIMVGGDPAILDTVAPILRAMGENLFHAGPIGSGHAMKALNNYVSAAGLVAASEAVRIGAAFGLKPAAVVDILNASTGRNNSTENKFHQFILPKSYASGFSLGLMAKDIGLAGGLSRSTAEFAPLLAQCEILWQEALKKLGPAADHTEFIRYLEGHAPLPEA